VQSVHGKIQKADINTLKILLFMGVQSRDTKHIADISI
jgi:hypothetical protein